MSSAGTMGKGPGEESGLDPWNMGEMGHPVFRACLFFYAPGGRTHLEVKVLYPSYDSRP
jgi:hypothetical protein